jgi:hypothetical protein
LANLLARHFGVQAIWISALDVRKGTTGRALEICGSLEHVEVAEYVHTYMLRTAGRLWTSHQKDMGITKNAQRRAYLEGVMLGFRDKLDAEEERQVQEEGLVPYKDVGLEDWYGLRHPARSSGRSVTLKQGAAQRAGRAAGREVSVRKGVNGGNLGGPRRLTGPTKR